jgi:hypothetical protein
MFTEEAGWPFGEVKDSDGDIVKKSRTLDLNNPARNVQTISTPELPDVSASRQLTRYD